MEIVEKPSTVEVNIDAEKLKFFNTKLKVWDYAKISFSDYQKLVIDNRSSILKSYYRDMCKNYSVGSVKILCFIIFFTLFYFEKKE